MMWINLNLNKDPEWLEYVRNMSGANGVLQAYVIHKDYDCSRSVPASWWKHQSNVHGVVMVPMDVPKATIHEYPRTVETIVEHFVPGIIVTESDFEAAEHIDIIQFLGKDKKIFLAALETGVSALLKHFRSSHQRKERKYVFHSPGIVTKAVAHCDDTGTSSADDASPPRAKYLRRYF